MVLDNLGQMSDVVLFGWLIGLLLGGLLTVAFWIGLFKLARANRKGLFVLSIFIQPVAMVSAFFKFKPKK